MKIDYKAILSFLKPYLFWFTIILIAMFFAWRTTKNNVKARYEIELLKQKNDYEKVIRSLSSEYEKTLNKYEFKLDSLDVELSKLKDKTKVIYVYREKDIKFINDAGIDANINILSNYLSKNDSLLGRFVNSN